MFWIETEKRENDHPLLDSYLYFVSTLQLLLGILTSIILTHHEDYIWSSTVRLHTYTPDLLCYTDRKKLRDFFFNFKPDLNLFANCTLTYLYTIKTNNFKLSIVPNSKMFGNCIIILDLFKPWVNAARSTFHCSITFDRNNKKTEKIIYISLLQSTSRCRDPTLTANCPGPDWI